MQWGVGRKLAQGVAEALKALAAVPLRFDLFGAAALGLLPANQVSLSMPIIPTENEAAV